MKKWIDDHIVWIVLAFFVLIAILIFYFSLTMMCWTCPATNATELHGNDSLFGFIIHTRDNITGAI